MKVLFLRNTAASGVSYTVGQVAEVSDQDAQQLINLNKAQAHAQTSPKTKEREQTDSSETEGNTSKDNPDRAGATIETREPRLTTRDPHPKHGKAHSR